METNRADWERMGFKDFSEAVKFAADIRKCLNETYTVDGVEVKGKAVSDLLAGMRGGVRSSVYLTDEHGNLKRWHIPGCLSDFEYCLQELGFNVERGRNRRGQKATVVYATDELDAAQARIPKQ